MFGFACPEPVERGDAVESEGMQQIHTTAAIVYIVFMPTLAFCFRSRNMAESFTAESFSLNYSVLNYSAVNDSAN